MPRKIVEPKIITPEQLFYRLEAGMIEDCESERDKNFVRGAFMILRRIAAGGRIRECRECGQLFEAHDTRAVFCNPKCRDTFHYRRRVETLESEVSGTGRARDWSTGKFVERESELATAG